MHALTSFNRAPMLLFQGVLPRIEIKKLQELNLSEILKDVEFIGIMWPS